eukprot:gene2297-2442_t
MSKITATDLSTSTLSSLRAMNGRGAFVDSKGVRWDSNEAEYEGYLTKKSRWVGEWRKRYFMLKGSKLFFGKGPTSAPHGMIDLIDCISVKSAEGKSKKKNAIEIRLKEETFQVYSSTERERDEWIGQIGRAIVKSSGMYVEEGDDDDEEEDEEKDNDRKRGSRSAPNSPKRNM